MNNLVSINEDLPVSIYEYLYNFKNNIDFIDENLVKTDYMNWRENITQMKID